jgi:hypothetical protein
VAGPVFFFDEVATFQIVPSGACITPPYPQKDFLTGFSGSAPASRAAPMSPSTVAGWDSTSDSVNPRKPVVDASDALRANGSSYCMDCV